MERDYMHLGDITKRDIANEIRDIKTSHQYPEEGSTTAMTSIAACPCPVVPVNGCNRSPTFN